jgi:hypothetical protein
VKRHRVRRRANGGGSVPETSREGEVTLHVGGQIDRLRSAQLRCQELVCQRMRQFVGPDLSCDSRVSVNGRPIGKLAFLVFKYRLAAYDADNHHRHLTKRAVPDSGVARECECCRCPQPVDFAMARLRCWAPALTGRRDTEGYDGRSGTCLPVGGCEIVGRWRQKLSMASLQAVVFFAGKGRSLA